MVLLHTFVKPDSSPTMLIAILAHELTHGERYHSTLPLDQLGPIETLFSDELDQLQVLDPPF
jgi:hypothetical protein